VQPSGGLADADDGLAAASANNVLFRGHVVECSDGVLGWAAGTSFRAQSTRRPAILRHIMTRKGSCYQLARTAGPTSGGS